MNIMDKVQFPEPAEFILILILNISPTCGYGLDAISRFWDELDLKEVVWGTVENLLKEVNRSL